MSLFRPLALTLALALAPPLHAQTAPEPVVIETPSQAQLEAIAVAIWQQAAVHLAANEPRQAIPLLEQLVSLAPNVTRFRLVLARAYFLVGEDDKATFHFQAAQGDPLSPEEQAAVRGFLDRIAARKFWEVELGFNLLTESNPGNRTSTEVIDIGGLPFVITDTAESGTGFEARARVAWLPRIDRDRTLKLQLSGTERGFPDDSLDERRIDAEIGVLTRGDQGTELGFGLLAGTRDIGGEDFSDSRGAWATYTTALAPDTRVSGRVSLTRNTHAELDNRDGNIASLTISGLRALSSDLGLRGSLSVTDTNAAADFESGLSIGLTAGVTRAFPGGWVVIADAGLTRDRRDGVSGLFTEVREDLTTFVSLRALYRNLQIEGFTPIVGLRWEERRSSLDLYDYDNLGLTLGFTRQF
jgi:hypothetical protein